jgi:4-amino-4-deoxy-L-arabinose transferase-like glycosyltransferase
MAADRSGRRGLLLVLGLGFLLFFPGLGNHDLWNPNEPVFAEGAREMQERGTWLLPYVNGQVYLDKPILYFWALRLAALPWGEVTATSARLPSALAALLTLLVVYRFGRRYFSERAGTLAGVALATMPVFVWEARFAQMDPMLTLFLLLSVISFERARAGPAAPWLAASGAWAGLAVLTKGPVGLLLPGATALVVLLMERDLRFLRRPAWLAGAGAFVAVAVPWYLTLALTGHGDWLEEFFLRQNIGRFLDPFDHARPLYYYAKRWLTDLFPWCLFLPLVLLDRPRADRSVAERRAWTLMAAYAAVVLLFFSASGAKRGVYILPLYPAYALLLGRLLARALAGATSLTAARWTRILIQAGSVALAVQAVVGLFVVRSRYPDFAVPAFWLAGTAVAGAAAVLLMAARRRIAAALGSLAATLASLYLIASLVVAPQVDVYKSARPFSQRILEHAGPDAPLRSFRFWKWRSNYLFYTRRLMPNMGAPEELAEFLNRDEPVYVLVKDADARRLPEMLEAPFHRLETGHVGEKVVHLYSNRE